MFQVKVITGPNPFYPNNPDKQSRLNEAIKKGFITITQMTTDMFIYKLTSSGERQWEKEKASK